MNKAEKILKMYEKTGALQKGHFVLSSGMHSSVYLQSAKVLSVPEYLKYIGQELANIIRNKFEYSKLNLIVSPAMGGVIIGSKVGEILKKRNIFFIFLIIFIHFKRHTNAITIFNFIV